MIRSRSAAGSCLLAGILLLWAALVMLTERLSIYSLTGVATSASFLLFRPLAQMLVITTGRGNIDLRSRAP
ncbi:hypothetical protein F2981_24270 (plasmid) [Sinorhizobium meliloti]|nr:hypothetical protein [Sinorhizobium meliloti]